MRERAILFLSLGMNFVLAWMLLSLSGDWEALPPLPKVSSEAKAKAAAAKPGKTSVVVRRQHFTWAEIESTDYPTYIANLRRIGCPEDTIRDIIIAEVEHMFEQRRLSEVVTPDQQWWRSEPDYTVMEEASRRFQAMEAEKDALLTQLLGPGWNKKPQTSSGDPILLDGPVLSKLSPDTKAALFKSESTARERMEAYLRQKEEAGQQPDPAELAKLRRETRAELSKILSPEQLEEYLLRYSYTATTLRQDLRGFAATPEEFRNIFRTHDAYDEQIQALANSNDPASVKRRQELEKLRDAAVAQTIGPERFPLYVMTQNPLFQAAQTEAEKNGAAAEKVLPIFYINQLAQSEQQKINNDTGLSQEDREAALAAIRKQQQEAIQKVIQGQTAE